MTHSADMQRRVIERAGDRCEYCRMHQSLQGATFHVEHIVPTSKGGASDEGNLALACPSCNLHKSDRTEATLGDKSNRSIPLFNPREQRWNEHFTWNAYEIVLLSETGEVTIHSLDLNSSRR